MICKENNENIMNEKTKVGVESVWTELLACSWSDQQFPSADAPCWLLSQSYYPEHPSFPSFVDHSHPFSPVEGVLEDAMFTRGFERKGLKMVFFYKNEHTVRSEETQ